jgi:uncharacterized OB-fold protein
MSLQEVDIPFSSFSQFFQGAGEGAIALPHCLDCDRHHWYPMERCPHCFSARLEWVSVSGRGAVFSVTTVRYAFTATTRGATPYGIALVTLEEVPDVRLVCRAAATAECGSEVAIGDTVMISVDADAHDPATGFIRCSPAVGDGTD